MSNDSGTSSDPDLNGLKDSVLSSQIEFLHEELGDPGRYLPHLRSKGVLGMTECQVIRSKETFRDKIESLVSFMKGQTTNKREHSFDVLVEALKKQRVQAHIARELQKALVKAKENPSSSDNKVKEEELQLKSTSQYQESFQQVEEDTSVAGNYHPEYGQLPPAPSRVPVQPMASCDHESMSNDHHPEYGKLPPASTVLDSHSEFSLCSSAQWTSHSESTEPGGQSVYNSMSSAHMSDVFHPSVSTPTGSLSDCSFSSSGHDTMEVTKLKAMVQHLNDRLLEANAKLDEKDAKIQELERRLQDCQHKGSRDDRRLSKDCKKVDLAYAQPLRHNSSPYHVESSTVYSPCRYNTVPTIPGNLDHFHHRAGDTVVYNLNYSRNNTNASVSTL